MGGRYKVFFAFLKNSAEMVIKYLCDACETRLLVFDVIVKNYS